MMNKLKIFLKEYWFLLLILILAAFLRFYKLDVLPPGLYPDEAANGQDIIRIIEDHDFRAIYDTNGPRESLFIFLQGLFVFSGKIFDIAALNFTALSLRIAPAMIGTITVWAVYLFGKELTKSKTTGVIAAAALAFSSWHIQFSRNGFRAVMLPLMLCLIFYFFIRAYREGKLKDYIWFGVFLGLGFYTYLSIRMLPLAFGAFLLWTFFFDKEFLKDNYKKIILAFGAFTVVMIPMLIHFIEVPADVFGRASTSIFNPELNNGSALLTLLDNIKKELLMFNFSGDKNFRHNVAGLPMLELGTGIFMWVGLGISLLNFRKIEHFLMLSLFGAMSVPMIMTAEGIPHALRLVGVIPVVFVWIGMGLEKVSSWIKNPALRYSLITLLVAISGYASIHKYFVVFPRSLEAHEAYAEDMVSMANDINSSDQYRINYMITGEFGLKTVYFLTHPKNPEIVQLEVYELADNFNPKGSNYAVYISADWYKDASKILHNMGYYYNFKEVKSSFDGRTLYYVSEN